MKCKCVACGQEFLVTSADKASECPVCGSHDLRLQIGYASFWRRSAAFVADFLLWMLVPVPIATVLGALAQGDSSSPMAAIGGIGWLAWLFLSPVFIYFVAPFMWQGQTPGKRMLGIAVVSADGVPLAWWQNLLRLPAYFASYLPILVGFFWCIWDKEKRCFHDMLLQTRVIYAADRQAMAEATRQQQAVLQSAMTMPVPAPSTPSTVAAPLGADLTLRFPARWVAVSPKYGAPQFIGYRRGSLEIGKDSVAFQGWVGRARGWMVAAILLLFPLSYMLGNVAAYNSYGRQTSPVFCDALVFFVIGAVLLAALWDFGLASSETTSVQISSIKDVRVDAAKRTVSIVSLDAYTRSEVVWTIRPDQIEKVARTIQQRTTAAQG